MSEILESFEIVWQTLADNYFDPTFGGLDWIEVHDRYHPLIATIEDETTFYKIINKMLFELDVSHLAVIPPDEKGQIEPILSAGGSIGIDLRILEEKAVIISVKRDSPGEQAGLRPGFILKEVNGHTIQKVTTETTLTPPFNDRNKRNVRTNKVLEHVYGLPGKMVQLVYLDEADEAHEVEVHCSPRDGKIELGEHLPPLYIEFESKLFDANIGYIRFNAFIPPVDERFPKALESHRDTRGLIIDIRGNHGGVWPVRKQLAEHLVKEPILFWKYQSRDAIEEVFLEPVENPYTSSLVVLVDALSRSSAEEFAGAMQAIKRGIIIGEPTPGICVIGDIVPLPNGAILIYPIRQTITANGTVLEGHGVIPDVEVILDCNQLLQGIDSQLLAAIKYLTSSITNQ